MRPYLLDKLSRFPQPLRPHTLQLTERRGGANVKHPAPHTPQLPERGGGAKAGCNAVVGRERRKAQELWNGL